MRNFISPTFCALDFDEMVFQDAVDAFSKRERRYGGAESDDELVK